MKAMKKQENNNKMELNKDFIFCNEMTSVHKSQFLLKSDHRDRNMEERTSFT